MARPTDCTKALGEAGTSAKCSRRTARKLTPSEHCVASATMTPERPSFAKPLAPLRKRSPLRFAVELNLGAPLQSGFRPSGSGNSSMVATPNGLSALDPSASELHVCFFSHEKSTRRCSKSARRPELRATSTKASQHATC